MIIGGEKEVKMKLLTFIFSVLELREKFRVCLVEHFSVEVVLPQHVQQLHPLFQQSLLSRRHQNLGIVRSRNMNTGKIVA